MLRIHRAIAVATLIFVAAVSEQTFAQTIDDIGQWNALFSQGQLGQSGEGRLKWWFDGHLRFTEDANGFTQSIVRPGIGWGLNENSTLWAGYGWIRTSPINGDDIDEHRLWQQWTWSERYGCTKVAMRSRFEQRLVETGDDTGLRFRQFFRAQRSLPTCPPLTLVCWDELFFNLNDTDWGQSDGFGQNRVFVGFGIKRLSSSKWRTEIGYMNQTINQNGPVNRSNHILAINLFRSP